MRRLNPFGGMQISLQDATFWTGETATAIKQRINSDLYNPGVVNGLTVFESGTRHGTAAVTPGLAYDSNGERISVPTLNDQLTYSGALLNDTSVYQVALRYYDGNDGTIGLDVNGLSNFRHITDAFSVVVAKNGADTLLGSDVVLSTVYSTVPGASLIFDQGARNTFSAKFAAGGASGLIASCYIFLTGIVVYSPDGTKQARIRIDNSGFLDVEPINYVFS